MGNDQLAIRLLGGFAVAVGPVPVPDAQWHVKRAAELVKILALAPRHRMPRESIIDAFWPDSDAESGMTNVRKVAFHARRALDMPDGIVLEEGIVKLAPDHPITTDVNEFREAAQRALALEDSDACREAAALYRGELLPEDQYAEWCVAERAALRSLFHDVLAGGQLWGRLVREDPTHERAHRRAGAIRQFELLRNALRDELGVSPEPETVALYEQVLNMDGRVAPTPEERARALLAWGTVHWSRGDLDEAARTAAEVRGLAIDARLPHELTAASELLGLVSYAQGAWREVFARSFIESITASPDLAPFIYDANMCMCEFALWEPTGTSDITGLAGEMLDAGEDLDAALADAVGHLLRGEAGLLEGRDAQLVRADLEQAARLHEAATSVTGWALAIERLAQLDAAQDDQQGARDRHRTALQIAAQTSVPEHLLPWIYGGMLDGEDDATALRIIGDAEKALGSLRVCESCSMSFRIRACMACSRAGMLDRARDYLADAERVAGMWSGGPWHAAIDEATATLQRADGASASVVSERLEQAGDTFAAANRPRDAARCRAAAAALR